MKIGVILPTYKDIRGQWKLKFRDKSIPSMRNLRGLDFQFLINFQNYNPKEVELLYRMIDESTRSAITYSTIDYQPPVSMALIREKIAELDPSCDYFLCVDDDIIWQDGLRYKATIDYLRDHPSCGSLMCMGHRNAKQFGDNVVETNTGVWWTSKGLFLKNLPETNWLFCPDDVLKCTGTLEEVYAIYSRIELGYHAAKFYNFSTRHKPGRVDKDFKQRCLEKGRYDPEVDLHNPKFDGIKQTIRSKWSDPDWEYLDGKLPRRLHENYLAGGGKDLPVIVPVTVHKKELPLEM